METHQLSHLLHQTLSPDAAVVRSAADSLDRLSSLPNFPFSLLSLASGGEDQGLNIAAAAYLKNFTSRNIDANLNNSTAVSKEFRDALVRALLHVEQPVLKVLIEAFRSIIAVEFVRNNSWPELVPELRKVIQSSDRISQSGNADWKTINALTVLHSLIRPFQYFSNPKLAKEPVPPQLELIAHEILVPLLAFFHHCVEKVLNFPGQADMETEEILLIISKCIYFAVRSHMPSALVPLLPSLCHDLIGLLSSLSFDGDATCEDGRTQRLKTGKRSLLIFCALVTRHRKFTDRLMPDITSCALKLVKYSIILSKLDFLSERIISLSFDVLSRVLETGPGWRLVSPHFSSLLESAIFPALMMNEKDLAEWEEDADEYISKNLPSELEEISGFREDLFTARKSALNLLGVISMSKGPPVVNSSFSSKRKKGEKNKRKDRSSMGELLVLPFLSKFPFPTDTNMKSNFEYYGVLMACSSLLDFLKEQKSGFISILLQNRVLPLYKESICQPYLMASANWLLGEIASCLPEELNADVYSALVKALAIPDLKDTSCYPVRTSAAGAVAQLVENEYMPREWLPLLKVVVGRISDKEEESSIYFQLLSTLVEAGTEDIVPHVPHIVPLLAKEISKCLPHDEEPWPQMVERGFATLAVMAQCWEDSVPEESEQNESTEIWISGRKAITGAFSALLQQAWLIPMEPMDGEVAISAPRSLCMDHLSSLLRFTIQDITETSDIQKLRVLELLQMWSNIIANWDEWEGVEDISIFSCIEEIVALNTKVELKNFIMGQMPAPPAPPVPRRSIIEAIGAFVTLAFAQYPSAVYRASSCVHALLHFPSYSIEGESVKQSLVVAFSEAAFCRFKETGSKPCPLWKPLLLAIGSCFLCYPDIVEKILEKVELGGFKIFLSALAFISSSKFEHPLSLESETKLTVLALAKGVEELVKLGSQRDILLRDCFTSLVEASIRLKELQEEEEEDSEEVEESEDGDSDDDIEDDDDEDSEDDEREETEEEFLERCAKAAIALENGIEEGDAEEQEQEIELGILEEVDLRSTVLSLMERYRVFVHEQQVPPELLSDFLKSFPECNLYFRQQ